MLALLTVPGDDEQGIVDPDGQPHHGDQVRDEEAEAPDLSEHATNPIVTEMAKIPMMIGVTPAMSEPNTTSRTMIAAAIPIELAEAKVLFGDLLEVLGRGGSPSM